ncbi:MAG: type II toxin-antitoxin system RelE/ParE family toxin [Roseivirga sp.]|nr:type II toxin-antitoxin system RelE/ParE family toxin [Roseivirga sp.]
MTKIRLTYRALEDLDHIYTFSFEKWGENVANQYLSHIEECLELLKEYPRLLKVNDNISSRFKVYPAAKHFLVCDLFDDDIYVLTVQHMSADLINTLQEIVPSLEEEAQALYERLKRSR